MGGQNSPESGTLAQITDQALIAVHILDCNRQKSRKTLVAVHLLDRNKRFDS